MKDAKQAIGRLAVAATALSVLSATAGIKYWDNPNYRAFDVDCYVPGAVWNFDGIRNVGETESHSTTTTTWKNLGTGVSSEPEVYLQRYISGSSWSAVTADELSTGTYGAWTENGFVFMGNGRMRRDSPGTINTGNKYTMQFLIDADANDLPKNTGLVFNNNYNYLSFPIAKATGRLRWNTKEFTGDNAAFIAGPSFDYVTAIANNDTGTTVLFSGTEAPTTGDGYRKSDSIAGYGENGYAFGSNPDGSAIFKGTLKFFRYYKKALSNEEVAWNRVVDERRFFNRVAPLPITNAVVVSSVAASTEPAGTYAVDGSHVFTASRVATGGNVKYICTGYTLETWNSEAGDWGAPVFHARELSCKVEDSDRVRITWKWMDGEGIKTYDVSDYVWDGLEVFYDGICNVGTNAAHSTTATNWVNIGNGTQGASNDLKLQRYTGSAWADATSVDAVGNYDPGEWTDNGFTFAGQGRFRCDSPGKFNVGTSYSLQMLIDAKASEQISGTGVTTHAYPFAAQNQTFAFDIRRTDNNLYWCVLSAQSDYSKYPYISGGTYDYITAIMDGANNTQALFSGTAIPSSGTGYKTDTAKSYNDTGFALGGYGKTATTERFVGTLKSFRQYDHALTAAEVAQNRKVDDWRYFGKFAETDVIVQSTHPALQGNEPDGEYDVDGSHTFTAPANVTIKVNGKEIEYACAGYTVESGMWDTRGGATYIVCSNAQTVASTSYTYNESAGLVRLTWLWKPVRGLRTAADYGFDDYSQAGLVWNYDGIFNAGVGTHDSSATTWKNLGDRANSDLHWNGATSTGHWTDDGYVFAGGPRFKGNAGFILKNCTMQTLIDGNPADQTATTTDHAYFFNGSGSYFNFRLIKGSFNGSAANSLCWVAQNNMYMYFHAPGNQYSFATGIQDFDNKKAMMFPDTTIPTEYVKDGTYGAQRLYHEFTSMNIVTDSGYGLGNVNAGNTGFNGTVKFFRYYDRVLTAEEIVRNRNADAARYFGALGVTNVLVRTKYGDGGVQAESGAYTVEGSWTFTATTVKDRSGNIVPVAGCYIEELDANGTWKNKTWHEGATYTYTMGTDPKTVRLTWSNPPPGTWIILR